VRIGVVSSFPPTIGGISDYAAHVTEYLARDSRVERVTVFADQVPGMPAHQRVGQVEVRRVWRRNGIGTGPAVVRALQTVRPDVVWFNLGLTMFGTRPIAAASGLAAPLATTLLGYRTVVTLHELPALADLGALGLRSRHRRVGAALVPRLVLRASAVVVTLDRYRRFLIERYGARNIRRIPLGGHDRTRYDAEPHRETALVFGTFGPHKEPGLVAEAVAHLRRTRPHLQLIVAGADHPRYPGFMADCCARHGLDGSWVGYVPAERLAALFARATVVVIPSRASTGSSGVVYRAVSHARAVIASDLPDLRGLAQDEGLKLTWFAPGDPIGLAAALDFLLSDADRRRGLVRHNLQTIERLKPAKIVDAYLAAFDDPHRPNAADEVSNAAAAGGLLPALSTEGEA
jgi:glycosyltransferase involved in cell wall biosynthesis